jgi:SAM-dependent methyltransferase
MDPAVAQPLFDRLYREVAGYELSHAERNRRGLSERSVIYGEVIPAAFHRALSEVAPRPGEVFFDVGSGTGKAVFLAALCFDFAQLVGVELLSELNAAARRVLARYDAEVRPTLPEAKRAQRIAFRDVDLRQLDLSPADVVFAHAVCFERPLVSALTLQLERLRPGARVISVGQRLVSPELALVRGFPVEMEWGAGFAWIYRRR